MKRFLLLCLFAPVACFASQHYLKGNIITGKHRFFKLDDDSYWEVKLEHGYFSCDHQTGSKWWRFDPVTVDPGEDPYFPYSICNERNGDILLCKQVDPAIPYSTGNAITISIQHQCSYVKTAYSPFLIDANLYVNGSRFMKLDDGSYWEIYLENGFFSKDKKTGAFWLRGDQVKIGCSQLADFPYLFENQRNGEALICRQIDPAIPDSTRTKLIIESSHTRDQGELSSDN